MSFYGQYTGFGGGGGPVYESLITILGDLSLTTGLKLCLDAGDSVSYPSGQDWIDRSGNIGADEFHRGTGTGSDSADPTFNGSAGRLSSNEYFSSDGGDYFTYGATQEAWMDNLHKNSAEFTMIMISYHASGTGNSFWDTAGYNGNNVGINLWHQGNNLRFFVAMGGATFDITSDTAIKADAVNFSGISIDEAAGSGGSFFYLANADGSGYNQVSSADTFDATYSGPSTATSTAVPKISYLGNTGRSFMFAAWEGTALTKANLDSIWAEVRGRLGV